MLSGSAGQRLPGVALADRGTLSFAIFPARLRGPRRCALAASLFLALLFAPGRWVVSAAAQTVTATTGAVNGIVTDSTKAVVPGVTVSLSGPSLMTPQTATTDAAGGYRFSAVPPGDYALTFELAGFATIVREGIHVGLGFTATVDVELQPGGVNDSVTVSGAPVIDLASTEVSDAFRQRDARDTAGRARHLRGPGEYAGRGDGEAGRRRQRRARAAGLHGIRPARDHRDEPQRGRRHSRRRRQRRQRQLLLGLRLLRGDCDQGGRQLGGDAGAGHVGAIRQQVRRQRLSRQPLRGFAGRRLAGHQHRRRSDRAWREPAGPGSTRETSTGSNSFATSLRTSAAT